MTDYPIVAEGAYNKYNHLLQIKVKEIAASCVDRNLHLVINFERDTKDRIQSIKRTMVQGVQSFSSALPRPTDARRSAVEGTKSLRD